MNQKIANELHREFNTDKPYAAVVSDLTYVIVGKKVELCKFISRPFQYRNNWL